MDLDIGSHSCALIACEVLRDEIEFVLSQLDHSPEVVWLERGLHNVPKKLTATLQREVDALEHEIILLGYGLCGTGVCGISSKHSTIVVPRFHDCIGMLRSLEKGIDPPVRTSSYYLTQGWAEFFEEEALRYKKRYGEDGYANLVTILYENYESMTLLESQSPASDSLRQRCLAIAESLQLRLVDEKGSVRILKKLLTGAWDEEFLVLSPGEELELQDFIAFDCL